MCGRITVLTLDEIEEVIDAIERKRHVRMPGLDRNPPRAQARPGSTLRAIVRNESSSRLEPVQVTWGIEAPWMSKPAAGDGKASRTAGKPKLIFNTRLDSALRGGGMWAEPIASGRCILPAATFFEPHETETTVSPKTGRPIKQAYEFERANGEPLLLASVRDQGRLSVVTTEPNRDVKPIHARMPLALLFEEVPIWLEGDLADIAELADRAALRLDAEPSKLESAQLSLF